MSADSPITKPVVRIDLSGPGGNIFFVLGKARVALRRARRAEDAALLLDRVERETHSYEDALAIVREYVELDV